MKRSFQTRKRLLGENYATTLNAMNQLELVDSCDNPYDDLVPFEAYTRGMQALRDNHRTYTDSVIHLTRRMAAKDASARKQALVFSGTLCKSTSGRIRF